MSCAILAGPFPGDSDDVITGQFVFIRPIFVNDVTKIPESLH